MKQEDLWLKSYYHAKKYYEENKNLLIPIKYVVTDDATGEIKLGIWLSNQRVFYRKNKLPEYRIQLLEELDIKWYVKGNESVIKKQWMTMFNCAKTYYEKYGSLERLYDYELNDKEDRKIRHWLNKQIDLKNQNKLNNEQIRLLDSIKMIWKIDKEVFHPSWDRKYKLAKNYYLEHGHLLISSTYEEKDETGKIVKLGNWISEQRRAYKKEKSRFIGSSQIEMLNEIGMVWKVDRYYLDEEKDKMKKELWIRYFLVLREYKNAYNTLNMPFGYTCYDKKGRKYFLYDWLNLQASKEEDELKLCRLDSIDKNWRRYVDIDKENTKITLIKEERKAI